MNAMMSQLGIKQHEIPAEEVIIKCKDKNIIIKNPSVSRINFSGNDMFQISGKVEESEEIDENDILTIMDKTKASREKAIDALKKSDNDLAAAIIRIKKG